MEILNETGKTKTPQLRVTKSIGALLIGASCPYEGLKNEKITAHIERANGDNQEIATNISLKAFIATSVFGEGTIKSDAKYFSAVCEMANDGAIDMAEDETLVLSFTGLNPLLRYTVEGLEMPVKSSETVFFTEKVVLNGQKSRKFDVEAFDEAVILGDFDKVKLTYATDEGSSTIELSVKELRALSFDMGNLIAGSDSQVNDTVFSLVGVMDIEIFTSAEENINIVLRDIDKNI